MALSVVHHLVLRTAPRLAARLRDGLGLNRRPHCRTVAIAGERLHLVVLPGVFFPSRIQWSSRFFAPHLAVTPETRLWDLGTGTGILAILAAKRGARVVATDVSPAACRSARINAILNDVADRVEVREGDLFQPIAAERFDGAIVNFPFFALPVRAAGDERYSSGAEAEMLRAFAAGIGGHLHPGGVLQFIFSENHRTDFFLGALAAAGFRIERLKERRRPAHRVVVVRAVLAS